MAAIEFHHFGLAVNDFKDASKFYTNLGYQVTTPIIDPLQNVELAMCTLQGAPSVELVRPVDDQSPIVNLLKKNGEMIYHTCYELEDVERDLKVLFAENRALCVVEPKSAILFDNREVSFYYVNNVGLVEVLQK